jgi:autotransporter-associated beta strand protein
VAKWKGEVVTFAPIVAEFFSGPARAVGASLLPLTLLAGLAATPAYGANYTAANEAELQARIAQANADGDPSSTITLTAPITLSDPAASLGASTKPLVIDTAGFQITSATPAGSVTYGGAFIGSGGVSQSGAGTIILTGANTYNGPSIISAGTLRLADGGQVNGTSGTAITGNGAGVTVTGAGTEWRTGNVLLGTSGVGGASTVNVGWGAPCDHKLPRWY